MKNDNFIYFCKCLFQIYGIPVRIYKSDKLMLKYELMPLNEYLEPLVTDELYKWVTKDGEPYKVFQTPNLINYGYIKNKNSDLTVLLGPQRTQEITKAMLLENSRPLITANVQLPDRIYNTLDEYMNCIPIMQTGRFVYIVSSIISVAQEIIISPDEMKVVRPTIKYDPETHKEIVKHFEMVINGDVEISNYYDYEKRFLKLIKLGMTKQLAEVWQDADLYSKTQYPNNGSLRTEKNNCISAIGIITNAVLNSGLDPNDVYKLRTLYIKQAENCATIREVINLRYTVMMDFCKQIEQLKYKSSNVPIVNYAIKFVIDNIDKKLSLDEVAAAVHVSRSYLCAEFSREMGIGLFKFIQEQKVNKAKQFLISSDKTLSEISNILSFSSQSYFQKVFKEITGTTPKEFREQSK